MRDYELLVLARRVNLQHPQITAGSAGSENEAILQNCRENVSHFLSRHGSRRYDDHFLMPIYLYCLTRDINRDDTYVNSKGNESLR